jgi:5,10-methylenetetrahydrofolate reductase
VLSNDSGWLRIAEVNPPELPDLSHRHLDGAFSHVLVTDNVFGRIRVSPYAYAARVTHDVPSVHPTVVVSTRDRNILAIESEVRGALGNGVNSFLVVVGDTLPAVEHLSHHYEIVEHLRNLQDEMPPFEVGMPTRFRRWQYSRRIDLGAQFLVAGPVIDPSTVEPSVAQLRRDPSDPPLYLMVIPPFSVEWIDRMESVGAVPATPALRARLAAAVQTERRALAWEISAEIETAAVAAGCAGVVLMGLKQDTVINEAARNWRRPRSRTGDETVWAPRS